MIAKSSSFTAGVIVLALAATGGVASAADIPVKAPVYKAPVVVTYPWTGFYVGINGGYAWAGSADATVTPAGLLPAGATPTTPVGGPFGLSTRPQGWLFGGQIGYNYQFHPNWVVGVEADFDFADIKDSDTGTYGQTYRLQGFARSIGTTTLDEKLDYFGTLRARLGFVPSPTLLAYVTGGLAWGHISVSLTDSVTTGPTNSFGVFTGATTTTTATASADNTRFGYVLGGGLEWMFMPNWSVRGEYLFLHFDNSVNLVAGNAVATASHFNAHILRAALNFHFNGP